MANLSVKLFLLLILPPQITFAASCCGGSASGIGIITNDARLKLGSTYSNTLYLSDFDSKGVESKRSKNELEIKEVLNFLVTKSINDYQQISIEAGLVKNSKETKTTKSNATNIRDFKISYAYEFLPELFYHPIKPRGFVYTSFEIPIEKSKYDFKEKTGVDVAGTGLVQFTTGFIFIKNFRDFSFKLNSSITKPFNRTFDNGYYVKKEMGYSASLEITHSGLFESVNFSVGIGLQEQGKEEVISNGKFTTTKKQIEYPVNLGIGYDYSEELSLSVSYIDTSFINSIKNSSSYKQVSLALNWLKF